MQNTGDLPSQNPAILHPQLWIQHTPLLPSQDWCRRNGGCTSHSGNLLQYKNSGILILHDQYEGSHLVLGEILCAPYCHFSPIPNLNQ